MSSNQLFVFDFLQTFARGRGFWIARTLAEAGAAAREALVLDAPFLCFAVPSVESVEELPESADRFFVQMKFQIIVCRYRFVLVVFFSHVWNS